MLEGVASEIFRGDTKLQVHGFSPGQQLDCVGRAVHQLVREDQLQLDDFPDFEAAVAALSQAVQRRAAAVGFELSICDEARAPDLWFSNYSFSVVGSGNVSAEGALFY